jgi:hypothetical protein
LNGLNDLNEAPRWNDWNYFPPFVNCLMAIAYRLTHASRLKPHAFLLPIAYLVSLDLPVDGRPEASFIELI